MEELANIPAATKTLIAKQVSAMHEYQKINNIKRQCITNTKYLFDCIKLNKSLDIKATATLVIGQRSGYPEKHIRIIGWHMVLLINGELIDPSYEVDSMINKKYFYTYKDYIEYINSLELDNYKEEVNVRSLFNDFVDIAKLINADKYYSINTEYYDKQAEYVDENVEEFRECK